MLCSYERVIYPQSLSDPNPTGFMVAVYTPHEKILDSSGQALRQIKAVGYFLPTEKGIRYDIQGHWERGKHGDQYAVTQFAEVIQPTEAGIIAYLSSGYIKGIGEKTAQRIYAHFGDEALDILDREPHRLLEVRGISPKKLERISESYMEMRGARDIITLLSPFGIAPKRAVQFFKIYGREAADIIRQHPYRLCEVRGIGFKTADVIAKSVGFDPCGEERIDAALLHVLKEAETGGNLFKNAGNLCIPTAMLVKKCMELLETPKVKEQLVRLRCQELLNRKEIAVYQDQVYRYATAKAEEQVAMRVGERIRQGSIHLRTDLDAEIVRMERLLGVTLAPEQRMAVKTCLHSPISIITGGPGTGKTMIQRFILELYKKANPTGSIVCCAPTGRAARRMEQATGHPASTIHKALGLFADTDGEYGDPAILDADLVIAAEVSMLDIHLAKHLLNALPSRCQLILVGDADQLPSVGPGSVLYELLASGAVPAVKLDKVYRQSTGSRIAVNAALIRHGTLALEYGLDFTLIESGDFEHSADILETLYLQQVQELGMDNVILLSPYRAKTATGVNALNARLRDKLNPPAPEKPELAYGKRVFRQGDKVMQTQNVANISNGDMGIVTGICRTQEESRLYVDFGDGRTMEYAQNELDALDLAYATTVHKSQGSEYDTVILSLQTAHYIMLRRPLLYTAITRAKRHVIIVGERKALVIAIGRADAEKRGTMLAERINEAKAAGV